MNIPADEEELDWMGGNCWFCGQHRPVHGKSRLVKMKRFTDGPGDSVKILRTVVAVPRCAECAAVHLRVISSAMNVAFGGAALVFLVVVVWNPIEMSGWLKAILVLAGLLPGLLRTGGTSSLPPGWKPESAAEAHPAVEAMRQGGWMKDDAP